VEIANTTQESATETLFYTAVYWENKVNSNFDLTLFLIIKFIFKHKVTS
jgi:hypothetical protein